LDLGFDRGSGRRHYFDIASINVLDVQLLKKKGLLDPYVSPHREGIPEGLRDKEGFWTGNFIILYVVGYNTRMITKGKIPADWWNLLDPMWKGGKIGLDRDAVVWYAALRQNWGWDKSIEFFKKLSNQQPRYERGNTLRTQMMTAGEFALAVVHAHKVEEFKSKGAPIDWVTTSNPIPAYGNVADLSSNAPHPHAARLFLDYLFSKEGQLVV
jgi:iron(III) transport system substrate-binding protein